MKKEFPLKDEFKKYCKKFDIKSVDAYSSYINQGLLQSKIISIDIFERIKKNIDLNDIETIKRDLLNIEEYFYTKKSENKIWGDRVSGIRKYSDFLEEYLKDKASPKEFLQIKDGDIDVKIDLEKDFNEEEDQIAFEDNKLTNSIVLTKKEVSKNFYLRLISQNRFPKEGVFYPISFIKQVFYKRGEQKKFDEFINKQIDKIKIKLQDNIQMNFRECSSITINNFNVVVNKKEVYTPNHDNTLDEKLIISCFKELEIDHIIPMKRLLNENKDNLPTIKEISKVMRKGLHKPLSYKKIRNNGSRISKTEYINNINLNQLFQEIKFLDNLSDMVLMHKKHNNKKRAK